MSNRLGLEVGKTYLSSYWCKRHAIIDEKLNKMGVGCVTSQWEDGEITNHATSKREMDWLITEKCEPCEVRNAYKCQVCENHMY